MRSLQQKEWHLTVQYRCTIFIVSFKRYVGMSVTDYIRKRRLTHAAQTLVSTERAVIDIAMQYGFPHKRHLRELLKECFNCHQRNIESTSSHFI